MLDKKHIQAILFFDFKMGCKGMEIDNSERLAQELLMNTVQQWFQKFCQGDESFKDEEYTVFIAALFIVPRTWKQPRCPSADEWIRKLWYIYTMEYYSAIKKNGFESVLTRWMKLEPIIQPIISQKEKQQYSTLTHI